MIIELQPTTTEKYRQKQTTNLAFTKESDELYHAKVLTQKIHIDDISYEQNEIYGVSNKGQEGAAKGETEECIVCLTNKKDTAVMPCRHMCLCASCASVMRTQNSKCPICRTKVKSLLQIKIESMTAGN
jgi:E3 ubiquitin-protein ligase MGRN1